MGRSGKVYRYGNLGVIMVHAAFKEPSNVILMAVALVLLLVFIYLIFQMSISKEFCLEIADQITPNFWEVFSEYVDDMVGLEPRPLKWLCNTLLP